MNRNTTNLKEQVANIIAHLKEAEDALDKSIAAPGAPSRVRTALHLAQILEIGLQYPAAFAQDIVDTDPELASDLHTFLGHILQDKEVA